MGIGMLSGFLTAWFVAKLATQERGELEALRKGVCQLRASLKKAVGRNA